MTTEIYSPGLEGVIAGETAISTVADGLRYRGYPVTELAEQATFDEVAYLLLHGELPTVQQLADFQKRISTARCLPGPLINLFGAIPQGAPSMDVLRSAVSILAHFDPDVSESSREANLRKAERLLGQIPVAVAVHHRISKGQAPLAARPDLGHAANFLYMLRGREPSAADARAFDVSLILYAEHEFNASTFAARVVCSTESDLHSSIVAAIGALKGRLHGGANEKVMELLEKTGGPANAEKWVREALARKDRIMGFGHRVYKAGDVRAGILRTLRAAGGGSERLAPVGRDGRDHRAHPRRGEAPVPQSRLAGRPALSCSGFGDTVVHADFRHVARGRLERARHRAVGTQPANPAARPLHRPRGALCKAAG